MKAVQFSRKAGEIPVGGEFKWCGEQYRRVTLGMLEMPPGAEVIYAIRNDDCVIAIGKFRDISNAMNRGAAC